MVLSLSGYRTVAASLVAYSSIKEVPLMFEILQGSLLAGGVTSGAIAATQLQPWTCLTIGLGLGVMIVVSGLYLEPLVSLCLSTPRAYLSLTVHGIPALLGAVIGVILAAISEEKLGVINYRNILYQDSLCVCYISICVSMMLCCVSVCQYDGVC